MLARPTRADRRRSRAPSASRRDKRLYLKREDLIHTGATSSTTPSARLCSRSRLGQTADRRRDGCRPARGGDRDGVRQVRLEGVVYMGEKDMPRQRPQRRPDEVARYRGPARWTPAGKTLKDAVNKGHPRLGHQRQPGPAITCWARPSGPHPYPLMVRQFQAGDWPRIPRPDPRSRGGRLPDYVLACVGGGSNSIGMFHGVLWREAPL